MRGKLGPMVGDQELDIEGGVDADPLPGLWDVQGVGRVSTTVLLPVMRLGDLAIHLIVLEL